MSEDFQKRITRLEKRLQREINARQSAEDLLEGKSTQLFEANNALRNLNFRLEERVAARTRDLERERAAAEEQARTDHLTGLANRLAFSVEVPPLIRRAFESEKSLALLVIDLDRFKTINDRLGHAAGDDVLRTIAKRLSHCIRPPDRVFRLGGDEFAVAMMVQDEPEKIAKRVHEQICQPMTMGGAIGGIGASIGVAVFSGATTSVDLMLKHADLAAYCAKRRGGGVVTFHEGLIDQSNHEEKLVSALHDAIDMEEFVPWFQPIVAAQDLKLVGLEALARWPRGDGSFTPPSEFIPHAEQIGRIDEIGMTIARKACRDVAPLARQGQLSYLSLNLSPLQFNNPDLAVELLDICDQEGLPPEKLMLEITESLLLTDMSRIMEVMTCLSSKGVRFALDDFGVGYSNLRYLQSLPVSLVKIDRSFLIAAPEHDRSASIVSAITALAHRLSLDVVIEGVETESQLELSRELGCDLIQGFLIGKPAPLASLSPTMLEKSTKTAMADID